MKALLKVAVPLGLAFASTFVIAKGLGILGAEQVRGWFDALKDAPPLAVGALGIAWMVTAKARTS